jgi:hypothetical protein
MARGSVEITFWRKFRRSKIKGAKINNENKNRNNVSEKGLIALANGCEAINDPATKKVANKT